MIYVATDFSDVPAGRNKADGEFSGEKFRDEYLIPKLKNATKEHPLVVNINDAEGYGSSFLEEAFGGLIREGYSEEYLKANLKIEANEIYKVYKEIIWQHIKDAANQFKEASNQ